MTDHADATRLDVIDLGRMAYGEALRVQRQTHERVLARAADPTLLLVEHEPVITITGRADPSHLVASRQKLAQLGIEVADTDRGGDITYHGPGQLVAYPILQLDTLRFNIGRYMHWLEGVAIDTAAAFGVDAFRIKGITGVWAKLSANGEAGAEPGKLCAAGVRVQRNVTLHGLALNVSTNLDHFEAIVPCGLAGCAVTNLASLLGPKTPTMDHVKQVLADTMRQHLAQRAALLVPARDS